ncbi:MAG: RlmE family RNA methyltransferase [Pseudomonadota bacterium]
MKKLKTGKGRKASSQRWLTRQLNDPYVEKAHKEGYRSRAAYKLLEIDQRFRLLKTGMKVIDLGAAPGGWCQVVMEKIGDTGKLVAIDLLPVAPLKGAIIFEMDFMDDDAPRLITEALGEKADIVLSDMAPNTIGHQRTDHLRIVAVVEAAVMFAEEILKPGGSFIAKVFQGGAGATLVNNLKKSFDTVKHVKPPASRSGSSEMFVVAQGFRGN